MSQNRLTELLADQTLFGLDSDETRELRELAEFPEPNEIDSFELAAALVDLSMLSPNTLPEDLEQKLKRQGRETIGSTSNGKSETSGHVLSPEDSELNHSSLNSDDPMIDSPQARKKKLVGDELYQSPVPRGRIREIVAWGCAAAIGFVALMVWTDARSSSTKLEKKIAELQTINDGLSEKSESLDSKLGETKRANQLLESQIVKVSSENLSLKKQINPDGEELFNELVGIERTVRWDWAPTGKEDNAATGEVVWNGERQKGVMRLVGLEQNDPTTSQYQLWIIEADGREHPVDGGVFDVKSDSQVYIPIDPKLMAGNVSAFAITVEKPGGVVVSDRKNLPYIAKAPIDQK